MEQFVLCILMLALVRPSLSSAQVPSVTLSNCAIPGLKMPVAGLGTGGYVHEDTGIPGEIWNDSVAERSTTKWLTLGGRRIDAALKYLDQVGVGRGVINSGIPRENIFVTSKLLLVGYNETFVQMDQILKGLQMDYVDLLLVHYPKPQQNSTDPTCQQNLPSWKGCRQSVWKAMTEIFSKKQARAIGVSNFAQQHIEDIILMNTSLPAVNQVEFQPYWHDKSLVKYCQDKHITFNSYSSLGTPDWAPFQRSWNGTILSLPVIQNIAKGHGHSSAQVLQKWAWQQGIVLNVRTLNPNHMKENLNFFHFNLLDSEMEQISSIKPPANPKVCPDFHDVK